MCRTNFAPSTMQLRPPHVRPDSASHLRALSRLLALTLTLVCASAAAGGSFERVYINRLSIINGVEYELVVTPLNLSGRDYVDPYMGRCATFTVHGTYSRRVAFPSFVTRDGHRAALAYLRQAHEANQPVNLGWVGTGFVPIDPALPCTVRSRALNLYMDQATRAVLSYHDAL
jgi:hypothetical protein